MSIGNILNIGKLALFVSQTALEVTSNNISNADTAGYSRRTVVTSPTPSIYNYAGEIGTGVEVVEIVSSFNQWIENAYNDKASLSARWDTLYSNLSLVESQFNEANSSGISSCLSDFFQFWQNLSLSPSDYATREELISGSETLLSSIHQLESDLKEMQVQVNDYIGQEVDKLNQLMVDIAELNKQIEMIEVTDTDHANELRDERSLKVRELAEIVDINYIDNGGGDVTITDQAGHSLVDGSNHYRFAVEGPQSTQNLENNSTFDGYIHFEGTDDYEYTVEVVRGGVVSNASTSNVAMFKVSLDGGKTWLKDEDGNVKTFYARPEESKVSVGDLDIWFGSTKDSQSSAPTTEMTVGDGFNIVPKTGLYWYKNTSSKVNVTPQSYANGEDNERRITGGTLSGYFSFRDKYVGEYKEKLDTMARELIWQTNLQHSQGAGLTGHTLVQGTYGVENSTFALGSDECGLIFGDKLSSGSSLLYIYSTTDDRLVSSGALDFSSNAGQQNFDPNTHSLQDVADAVNRSFGTYLTASIVNNKLQVTANSGYEFQFGTDTTGLMAALGLNTYFQGDSAANIELTSTVTSGTDFICAGHVNGAGEVNEGDNTVAENIADLATTKVDIKSTTSGTTNQTILEYYNALVGTVGTDTSTAKFNYSYQATLAEDLDTRQQEVSGVSIDEELTQLIKYQHSYTAAAKLITTADQMMQTILGMKQ